MTQQQDSPAMCGTNGGYQQHRRAGEPACDDCRAAANAYMKAWRDRGGPAQKEAQLMNRVRTRALWRLVDAHPTEWARLVDEERRKAEQ